MNVPAALYQIATRTGCWYVGREWPDEASGGWKAESLNKNRATEFRAWRESFGSSRFLSRPSSLNAGRVLRAVETHNLYLSFGYALSRAAAIKRTLKVLDWGGALGSYEVIAQRLFPELSLDWHVVELPEVCSCGARERPELTFHSSDTSWLGARYDLVVSSGAILYVSAWQELVRKLASVAKDWVFLTRMPVVKVAESFVFRQDRGWSGVSYPGWALNRKAILEVAAESEFCCASELLVSRWMPVFGAPEQPLAVGMLLQRQGGGA